MGARSMDKGVQETPVNKMTDNGTIKNEGFNRIPIANLAMA